MHAMAPYLSPIKWFASQHTNRTHLPCQLDILNSGIFCLRRKKTNVFIIFSMPTRATLYSSIICCNFMCLMFFSFSHLNRRVGCAHFIILRACISKMKSSALLCFILKFMLLLLSFYRNSSEHSQDLTCRHWNYQERVQRNTQHPFKLTQIP